MFSFRIGLDSSAKASELLQLVNLCQGSLLTLPVPLLYTLSWSPKAGFPQTGNKYIPSSASKRNGGKEEDLISFLWWYFGTLFPLCFITFLPPGQIVGMESIQPPIPLCHLQVHAYSQRKVQEWLNNQAALQRSLLCKGGIICPEVKMLLQGFQEQLKLLRLVPLLLRGEQSGVGDPLRWVWTG